MRLPRDWLGPREELVPIGSASRARARAAGLLGDDPLDDLPPTAHDFWGEDSAALHDAIQGPATADPWQPLVNAPAPVRTAGRVPRFRPPHVRRPRVGRPQLTWPSGLTDLRRGRRAWLLLPVPLIVAVVTVAAFAGGGSSRPPGSRATHTSTPPAPSQSTKAAGIGTTTLRTSIGRPRGKPPVARVNRAAVHRRASARHGGTRHARSRLGSHVRYVSRSSAPPAATSPSPATDPVTSANPVTTSAPTPAPTVPHSNSSAPANAASGSHTASSTSTPPHFGSNGSLGPGSSPDS